MVSARTLVVLGLVACGAAGPPAVTAPHRLAAGETITITGATLEVPAAWWVVAAGELRAVSPRPRSTDRSWIAPLTGTYRDAALGEVTIHETTAGAVLDAGEWRTAIDRQVDAGGTAQLVLLDPPFAGGTIIIAPDGTLRIPGQTTYVFTRTDAR